MLGGIFFWIMTVVFVSVVVLSLSVTVSEIV